MTAYKSISTLSKDGIIIEIKDDKTMTLTIADLSLLDTAKKIEDKITEKLDSSKNTELFIHQNKNGSWCVATGVKPEKWLEDEK